MRGGTRPSQPFQLRFGISIHPPHAGWDSASGPSSCSCVSFQSTHPMRGGTLNSRCISSMRKNFNPPTPCGVGHGHAGRRPVHDHISIHPPHAGWDHSAPFPPDPCRNFNPPTPCGVGPSSVILNKNTASISIHLPHAGWDSGGSFHSPPAPISIHPPHAGVGLAS